MEKKAINIPGMMTYYQDDQGRQLQYECYRSRTHVWCLFLLFFWKM